METIPLHISILFIVISFFTVGFFYMASQRSWIAVTALLLLSVVHSTLAAAGFYLLVDSIPPRATLFLVPTFVIIILLFTIGKKFIYRLDLGWLTLLHVVRIPVEIGLFLLFQHQLVPEVMTFEGRNFDIISGLTAPLVYYFGFIKKTLPRKLIITWNIICLGLLINIVINAVLAIPSPFQQQAFDQPNVAVLYFPVVLLPVLIVAVVLFAHLVCIVRLMHPDKLSTLKS